MNDNQQLDGYNVTKEVLQFREFLIAAWPHLSLLMKNSNGDASPIHKWVQLNWEFLVERKILGKESGTLFSLSIDEESRITPKSKYPVYAVISKSKQGGLISNMINRPFDDTDYTLRLHGFSSYSDQDHQYGLYPPFKIANLHIGKELFFAPIEKLKFTLYRIYYPTPEGYK